jgi:hypothetical protein
MTTAAAPIVWPTTPEGWCDLYHVLDTKFSTEKRSPLHHDHKCPIHGRA